MSKENIDIQRQQHLLPICQIAICNQQLISKYLDMGWTYDAKQLRQIDASLAALYALTYRKYDPNQPRVPAGQPGGGQWTDGGDARQVAPTVDNASEHDESALYEGHPDLPLEPVYPELLLGFLKPFVSLSRAWTRIASRSFRDTAWKLGAHKSAQKWSNRIKKGDWTPEQITATIKKGDKFRAPNKINPDNGATRYQRGDRFVVRDNKTGEILQISRPGQVAERLD